MSNENFYFENNREILGMGGPQMGYLFFQKRKLPGDFIVQPIVVDYERSLVFFVETNFSSADAAGAVKFWISAYTMTGTYQGRSARNWKFLFLERVLEDFIVNHESFNPSLQLAKKLSLGDLLEDFNSIETVPVSVVETPIWGKHFSDIKLPDSAYAEYLIYKNCVPIYFFYAFDPIYANLLDSFHKTGLTASEFLQRAIEVNGLPYHLTQHLLGLRRKSVVKQIELPKFPLKYLHTVLELNESKR